MVCWRRVTFSRRKSDNPTIVRMPTGTLIQKIQCQENASTMMPPASGPTIAEKPHTLDSHPCTRGRSCGVYRSPTIVVATGWIEPAPRPCSRRNAINAGIDHAKPHSVEPRRKTTMPAISTGRRP